MLMNDAAGFSALSLALGEDVVPQDAAQEVTAAKRRHHQRQQQPQQDEIPEVLPEYYSSKYAELPDETEVPSSEEAAAAITPAAPTSPDTVQVPFSPSNAPVTVTSTSSVAVPVNVSTETAEELAPTPDENAAAEVGPASPPAAPPAPAAAPTPAAPEMYHPGESGGQSVFVAAGGGTSPWIYVGIAAVIGLGIFFYLKKK